MNRTLICLLRFSNRQSSNAKACSSYTDVILEREAGPLFFLVTWSGTAEETTH